MASTELEYGKVFNDSVHGYIEMHPLCVAIIDTEQFQRLRCIKQMGGTYFVYPGASHNRFEHSIGTSYLAGYFVESLRRKQGEELKIGDKDVLCVKIAGLCHDLGHGPFSHMFDNDFIPKVRPKRNDWSHEVASEKMFDHLIKSNRNVEEEFEKNELGDKDICFIKKLMTGETPKSEKEWEEVGREKNKPRFLFEIVANKINGVDVDKWDYFARDCKYLGIKSSFDHMRCIPLARVIKSGNKDEAEICYRNSAVGNIYDLFHTRLSIHKKACQHKTANAIEMMITEALEKADPHFKIKGENGRESTISTAIDDMVAYTKLTDHVYYEILYSTKDELKEARKILQNIEKRKLYKFIGYTIPKDNPDKGGDTATKKKEKAEELKEKDVVEQGGDTATKKEEKAEDLKEKDVVEQGGDTAMKKEEKAEELKEKDVVEQGGDTATKKEEKAEELKEKDVVEQIFKKVKKKVEELKEEDVVVQEGDPSTKKEIFKTIKEKTHEKLKDDIVVQLTSFSYGGKGDKNPVDKVLFYAKHDDNKSFKIKKEQVSRMLPEVFYEKEIRVYSKERELTMIKIMEKAFGVWCKGHKYETFYSYAEPLAEDVLET